MTKSLKISNSNNFPFLPKLPKRNSIMPLENSILRLFCHFIPVQQTTSIIFWAKRYFTEDCVWKIDKFDSSFFSKNYKIILFKPSPVDFFSWIFTEHSFNNLSWSLRKISFLKWKAFFSLEHQIFCDRSFSFWHLNIIFAYNLV